MFFELIEGENAELRERSASALESVQQLEARLFDNDTSLVGGSEVNYLWEDAETGE